MKNRMLVPLLAALLLATTAQAAEGSLSYRRVYELLYQFVTLPEETTSQLQFRGRVIAPGAETPRQLLIRHGNEPQPVPVDRFGLFKLPMSPQLAQLNPLITADPPARALKLGLAIVVKNATDLESLRTGVLQTNAVMRARARVARERVPQAYGVTLRFAGEETVTVAALRDGEWLSFESDEEGRIDLPLDDKVTALRITASPEVIFPLFP